MQPYCKAYLSNLAINLRSSVKKWNCHIFFYCGKIQNVHTHFQKYCVFVALKNLGHYAFQIQFCMTVEQNSLKPVKVGLLSENQDK